jgi:hypothetical protein
MKERVRAQTRDVARKSLRIIAITQCAMRAKNFPT